jgi:hypothetical protein
MSDTVDSRIVASLEFINYVNADGANSTMMAMFKDKDGKEFMLSMPFQAAADLATRFSEAFAQMQKQGKPLKVPAIPERIQHYGATRVREFPGEVLVTMDPDRSSTLLGRMQRDDARRLAALLTAAAEPEAPIRAN